MEEGTMQRSFRGSPLWDYRNHPSNRMAFRCDEGQDADDVKRRALRTISEHCQNGALGVCEIEGPLWALVDVTHGSERVKHACQWYQVAACYSEDGELRRVCCTEAYGWIERALRTYL